MLDFALPLPLAICSSFECYAELSVLSVFYVPRTCVQYFYPGLFSLLRLLDNFCRNGWCDLKKLGKTPTPQFLLALVIGSPM